MTDEEVLRKIAAIIEDMRPNIQMDGGDVFLDRFENGVVYIRLEGTCLSSPMNCEMRRESVQQRLMDEISDIHDVIILRD